MTRIATFASAFALAAASLVACAPSPPAGTSAPVAAAESTAAPAITPITPTDYSQPAAWLCRPGAEEACAPEAITVLAADGKLTKEHPAAASDAPIDCFYVYPTVSHDPAGNSDTLPGDEERAIIRTELAPFAQVCRLYAPVYRQVTVSALKQMLAGKDPGSDRELAYADVKSAWQRYLANDNQGSGVVLIGHSQGAGILTRLIAAEIDGKPAEKLLVSALLPGTTVDVPTGGAVVGGSFAHVPLCQSADSTGCAIAWSSFSADAPPPAQSLFGAGDQTGMRAACVNPVELGGSTGMKAELPVAALQRDPASATGAVETPLVAAPGLFSAKCIDEGGFSYLAIAAGTDPADKRAGAKLDAAAMGEAGAEWGLNALDLNLVMGNLVDIVKRQGVAWKAAQAPSPPAASQALQPPH